MKKGKFIALIIGALVITRLPTLFNPFIDVDEALFALFAKIWQHGGIPYVNAVETKALGIYCFYSLASWLSGSLPEINMLSVHVLTIIWTGLTAWVIGRIAARLSGLRAGLWAALLFVLFSTFFVPKIVAASMTAILLLPMCLVMDLLLRPAEEITPIMSFAAGVLVAAATLIKYQAGIMVFVVLIYFWIFRFPWRAALKHSFWFVLGGIPLPALMLGYLYRVGALPDFWYWNFGGSMRYIQGGSAAVDLLRKFKSHVLTFLAGTALVWGLSVLRFITWCRRTKDEGRRTSGWECEAGIWLWFFLCLIPVCLGSRFYGHYFLILMPQLCILSALQIVSWDSDAWSRHRKWVIALIALPFVATIIPRFYPQPIYKVMHEEVVADSKPYGDFLKSHTQPDDRILVWGFSPAVYWYADRLPATRFLWSDVLVGRLPGLQVDLESTTDFSKLERPELWQMFYTDLNAHPPAYIIDMAPTGMHNYHNFPMGKYPHVMEYVSAHYTPEPDLLGAKVFKRR